MAAAGAQKAAAKHDATEAVAKLDAMQRDLDTLDQKVRDAQHAVEIMTTETNRKYAQQLLAEAKRRAADARARQSEYQRQQDHISRIKPIDVSKCAGQVLCK